MVLFPRSRRVLINGEQQGRTNELIELEGGKYTVALGPPPNFRPRSKAIDLRNTAALRPLIVTFKEA